MIWAILVLLFSAYSVGVFFVHSWWVLLGLAGLNILLMVVLLINPVRAVRSLILFSPLIFLSALFNYLWADLDTAAIFAARLTLVTNMTFIFASRVPMLKFAVGLQICLSPLGLVKINTRNVALTIAIAVSFIPILRDEARTIRHAMRAKARRRGMGNLTLFFKIIMYKVLYRAGSLAMTLDAKGHR